MIKAVLVAALLSSLSEAAYIKDKGVYVTSTHLGSNYFLKAQKYAAMGQFWTFNGLSAQWQCNQRYEVPDGPNVGDLYPSYTDTRIADYQYGYFIGIDSKAYRRQIEPSQGACSFHNSLRYCPRIRSIWYNRNKFYYAPVNVLCFSEMPMPAPLVVMTETDQLGDHDCGVYPSLSPYQRQTLSGVLASLESSGASGAGLFHDIRLEMLGGGSTYRRLYIARTGADLLSILPVTENTIVIISPDAFSYEDFFMSASGSGSGAGKEQQEKLDDLRALREQPQRIADTERLPESIGGRASVITLDADSIARAARNQGINLAQSQTEAPALMIIGAGEGVKIMMDIPPQLAGTAVFESGGPLQLYNLDIEATMAEPGYLFEINHYLQLYRTSIKLGNTGSLFRGQGIINVSRSQLNETSSLYDNDDKPQCQPELMIRACRSDIDLRDMSAGTDTIMAFSGNAELSDYLNRLEELLPQKPIVNDFSAANSRDYQRYQLRTARQYLQRLLMVGDPISLSTIYTHCLNRFLCPDCPAIDSDDYAFAFRQQLTRGSMQFGKGVNNTCGSYTAPGITHTNTYSPVTHPCSVTPVFTSNSRVVSSLKPTTTLTSTPTAAITTASTSTTSSIAYIPTAQVNFPTDTPDCTSSGQVVAVSGSALLSLLLVYMALW